ncbi:short-chain dehydrogenase/reductase-like protein SDR [Atractiella rhizophila]|nr:short-chain dehydrogenase/reductase-like protein SDR [Atractiella rhizophila]
MATFVEDLAITKHHDVYPGIALENHPQTGRVVLVTGASKGIGRATALAFARAGCSAVVLLARNEDSLEDAKKEIEGSVDGVQVVTQRTDVTKSDEVKRAVQECVERFGKIDVVVSNAGANHVPTKSADMDPDEWWSVWEANVKSNYVVAHHTIPHLLKTKGYFICVGSLAAQNRWIGRSAYQTSKHALNRFIEFFPLEYGDDVKAIVLHPGAIKTGLAAANPAIQAFLIDTLELAAGTIIRLTSGKHDWLNGRFVNATWDLDELNGMKDEILSMNGLRNRLNLPKEA